MPEIDTLTGKRTVQHLPPLPVSLPLSTTPETPVVPAVCANCGTPLAGPYCARCGQHVADFHRSVWRFVVDFLDNAICWDNKLLRTLGPLFKTPGLLTREFMLGRRVRYVHPLRLFLFTSAVCLTLMQYSHNELIHVNTPEEATNRKIKRGVHVDLGDPMTTAPTPAPSPASPILPAVPTPAVPEKPVEAEAADGKAGHDPDNGDAAGDAIRRMVNEKLAKAGVEQQAAEDKADSALERSVKARIKSAGGTEKFSRAISDGVQQRLSWVALALLPVFAFGLRALYWRNDTYYFEHLIFSLHYHTFLLLFWTGYTGVSAITSYLPLHSLFSAILKLCLLLPPIYLFMALRRMYGDGPKRTVAKVLVLGSMHLLAIVIGVAAVGAAAFFSAK